MSCKSFRNLAYQVTATIFVIGSFVTVNPGQAFAQSTAKCTIRNVLDNSWFSMPGPFTETLDFCAVMIRGAANGQGVNFGYWGNYLVAVNRAGQVYVYSGRKWQYVGDTSERPVSDKCAEGDARACRRWGRNIDRILDNCRRGIKVTGICNNRN